MGLGFAKFFIIDMVREASYWTTPILKLGKFYSPFLMTIQMLLLVIFCPLMLGVVKFNKTLLVF